MCVCVVVDHSLVGDVSADCDFCAVLCIQAGFSTKGYARKSAAKAAQTKNTIGLVKSRLAKGHEVFTVKGLRVKNLTGPESADEWTVATCQAVDYDARRKAYIYCDKPLVRFAVQ